MLEKVKVNGATFGKMTQGKDLLADILPPPAYALDLHDLALLLLNENDTASSARAKDFARSKELIDSANQRHALWVASTLPAPLLVKEKAVYVTGFEFAELFRQKLQPLLQAGKIPEARDLFRAVLHPAFERHRFAVNDLVKDLRVYNAQIAAEAQAQENSGKTLLLGFFLCVSLLIGAWSVLIARRSAERRRVELQQLESEEQFRFALEAAQMGAWEWNIHTDEVKWSGSVEAMFGLCKGEFKETYSAYLNLIHVDDRKLVEKTIANTLSGQTGDYHIEHRVLFSDGSCHWLQGNGKVYHDTNGNAVRMRGTVADITARKILQLERESLEGKLRHSQRMEAVGKLAGGVAHDFNNILTGIMGYSELALDDLNEHPAGKSVTEILNAAERAANLTRQLLAFSRKQVLRPEVLDILKVIQNLQGMLDRLLGSQFRLVVEDASDIPAVKADKGQMEQVILNLVVNARDAMPEGGNIIISARKVDRADVHAAWGSIEGPGKVLMVAVSDEGIGIPAEVRANLFQPYFTTKAEGKGTGLGLSTVYGIVQQSGGAIGLDSEIGKGTTFRIYLLAADSHLTVEKARPILEIRKQMQGTVLVAEDDAHIANLIKTGLERHGLRVLSAANAEEASKLLVENHGKVDLLLTDVMMPGKSGRVLAEETALKWPDIKVLFMSGFAADETMHQTIEKLGADLIHKPFSPEILYRKVSEILSAEKRVGMVVA